jgi:uncharacterized cupredoxin-like copper-binding protein
VTRPWQLRARLAGPILGLGVLALLLVACDAGAGATPPISPGTSRAPRDVNIIARDYSFQPDPVDFVPGETVLLHVINGGLEVHEAILGDQATQDAWEVAEKTASSSAAPGPTPVVTVPPGVAGIRVVVASGQRVDLLWSIPVRAGVAGSPPWFVGCHIPGHWDKGMHAAVRWTYPRPPPS